jgi:hypothetical protein
MHKTQRLLVQLAQLGKLVNQQLLYTTHIDRLNGLLIGLQFSWWVLYLIAEKERRPMTKDFLGDFMNVDWHNRELTT